MQFLTIWYYPPLNYQRLVNIELQPKSDLDKITYSKDFNYEKLQLWSGVDREEKNRIHGFIIVLTFVKLDPNDKNKRERIVHKISLVNGKITGENVVESNGELYIDLSLD